ncbi:MAG: universal stress protein [Planctomycetes bacterium]|nr:universal stress protein [Planctomycetota bacterium]MCP4771724.1 universal stress protein [Planctomycetota bacterium]MCP4859976.1 universal stress protein [Planctomycetota bacterium]
MAISKIMMDDGQVKGPVLVPVDFSPQSEQAFLFAADYGRNFTAPILILHVMHDAEEAPGVYRMEDGSGGLLPLKEAARILLEEFQKRLMADYPHALVGLQVDFKLTSGIPATRILEVAEKINAQMIVIGNTGQGSISRILTGSTANKVIQEAQIPVTLIKALADTEE